MKQNTNINIFHRLDQHFSSYPSLLWRWQQCAQGGQGGATSGEGGAAASTEAGGAAGGEHGTAATAALAGAGGAAARRGEMLYYDIFFESLAKPDI